MLATDGSAVRKLLATVASIHRQDAPMACLSQHKAHSSHRTNALLLVANAKMRHCQIEVWQECQQANVRLKLRMSTKRELCHPQKGAVLKKIPSSLWVVILSNVSHLNYHWHVHWWSVSRNCTICRSGINLPVVLLICCWSATAPRRHCSLICSLLANAVSRPLANWSSLSFWCAFSFLIC